MGFGFGNKRIFSRGMVRAAGASSPSLLARHHQSQRRSAKSAVESLEARQLLSTSWYVSPSGSNQNPGTLDAPFQTIQAAANVAQAGDSVEIEAGTYHETVTPKNSGTADAPIVYEAYDHQSVTVSGADALSGWTNYNGDIYQAPMSWDLGAGNNEVFVDGQAMNEARWPNTSLDLMNPTLATATKVSRRGNSVTISNAELNQPANFWKGAVIHILPGNAWVAETDTVTASAPGQITFTFAPDSGDYASYTLPWAGNHFYLTNSFKTLDSDGEWYRDSSTGTLYLATPTGDNPAGHDVEVKHRAYAFDLTGKSYTTVQDISIFSATIRTSQTSTGTVLNGLHAMYISQFVSLPKLWQAPSNTGICLNGPSSILENSTIADSAGDGVIVFGANSRVTNNIIHDVDYTGSDSAGIRVYGDGSKIDHNTIYNTGRDGIKQAASKLQITYNTLHDIGLAVTEAGGIYSAGNDGKGSVIAYNTIYAMHSGGYGQTALFLDNFSSDYILHDNVVYDVDIAVKLNFTSTNNKIYNNTLSASQNAIFGNYLGSWPGTSFQNNVILGPARYGSGATVKNNVTSEGIVGTGASDFTSGASSDIVEIPVGVPVPVTVVPPADPAGDGSGGVGATGADPTSGQGASSGDPPVTDPVATVPVVSEAPMTATQLAAQVITDRAAIVADTKARNTMLQQLSAAVRADLAAYHDADHQLVAAKRQSARTKSQVVAPADESALSAQMQQSLDKVKSDETALTLSRRTDFTGIRAARKQLTADVKALAAARRHGHQ